MFEKFTAEARAVVRGAVQQADRTGSGTVGEPELLVALLDRTDSPAAGALAALGVHERRESVADALAAVRRRGGVSTADAEALAGLGIDIDAVVARVEEAHGEGALAAAWAGRAAEADALTVHRGGEVGAGACPADRGRVRRALHRR